ncbi:MAG: winged helix-turn-helix domain-containing protein [Nitrososphaera sp.]
MRRVFKLDIEVLFRILQAFENNPRAKKTHLCAASRVRWDSFLRYLELLESHGYVASSKKNSTYWLTAEGCAMRADVQKLLGRFDRLAGTNWLDNVVLVT